MQNLILGRLCRYSLLDTGVSGACSFRDGAKYFSHVVTAMDTAKPKPSPEALIKCIEALDVDMCSCIIAGDSVNDVRAGKAAGAATVAVLSGLYKCKELVKEHPDLILKDVTGLPAYIK